ncbi:DUF4157 domain-containing protein [Streptomyces sp. RY43-2]|uniref:DUF4157 domain-containing protein n=1 Tax=Streptomyces macrolidinus TaxID=2952607 RepID=A0ABT0ZD42_9ACTN|nr:DUF4157 domain-containing protein [Streptomyces macrolidinus]MCN9241496.1 DUF4157 domain-containing protein [Streptomyces macrolidinus]
MSARTQDAVAEQSAEQRRRKRRERAAKSRTPEPKNIVSGAGQPLDPGVRRELEEQLGHDLSRVRLHTGRDAGQLTELLGADAVAVGQDILFREGTFKPGTDEGRRLLAHELLHTVQNPHGLGALRAGRELGAVSLPQHTIEREAEGAAQSLVRPEQEQPAPEVREGQATPGWLRYATVDADRNRAEVIDPATLVDRLANSVVRSLRGDPEDLSRRTRNQLARLPEELLDGVLVRLENRLLAPEHDRVLDLVDEIEVYDDGAQDLELDPHDAPEIEPDLAEELRAERENALRTLEQRRTEEERLDPAPGPEKERSGEDGAAGSTPPNGWTREHASTPQGGDAPHKGQQKARGTRGSEAARRAGAAPGSPQGLPTSAAASGGLPDMGQRGGEKEEDGGSGESTERQATPVASEEESAARNRPEAVEAAAVGGRADRIVPNGQAQPKGSPAVTGKDIQLPGALSALDGVRNQDVEGLREQTADDPFGSGSAAEAEVADEPSAWDVELQPGDFLPQQDLDLSSVPAAEQLDPSSDTQPTPSFPASPTTKAERVRSDREAEDAEEAEAEEDSAREPVELEPSTETEGNQRSATLLGGTGLDQAATPSAFATRDPKNGDDPKAGPVTAQTTVAEAPGNTESTSEGDSREKESAAKEERGTESGGDRASTAPEKESQQAVGGRAAQSDAGVREPTGGAGGAGGTGVGGTGGVRAAAGSGTTGALGSTSVPGAVVPAEARESSRSPARTDAHTEAPAPAPAPAPKSAPVAARPAATAQAESGAKDVPETAPEAAPAQRSPRDGGGGGGAPAPARAKKNSAPVPNLSGVSPEAGLAAASKLKPHTALQAMDGVGGAVDRAVGDEHKTLAAAPPALQRPSGAPRTLQGRPRTDAPAQYSQDPAQQSQAPEAKDAKVTGEQEPEGRIEAEKAEEPGGWDTFKMALGFGLGKVGSWLGFKVDAQELAAKFAGLPTKDEALKQAQAGNAPGVRMGEAADRTTGEQDGHVDAKGQETVATARDDASRRMGEDQVYPDAPKEQLTAKVPGQQGGRQTAVGGGGPSGAVPPEAASEVAEHDRGPQFQAAFSDGRTSMSEGRQTKDRDFRNAQDEHKHQVDAEIAANTKKQAGERDKAMAEVTAQREDWRKEQDDELKTLGDKKTERHDKIRKDVDDEETKTDDDVEKEKGNSDKKIKDESDRAERDAQRQREGAVQDSGNWITKAFDWIKQKVVEIKNAIVRVIRAARDAVTGFIRDFRTTVERWINDARKNIVEAIKNFIKDLIEFAKAMVRAVIELADRVRKLITNLVEAAIALVNRLAHALKQAVTELLNAIGKLLSDILDVLKKMLQAAVKAVVDAVKAVLDFASKLLGALGAWMLIAVDFLTDPGGWLNGAKNSAVDGAKHHLFREVSSAVRTWFQEKIQEIIGVPKAIIDQLVKGGFTLDKIVKEAWDAVVPQLPLIIGELVITKVVAKLIPGAGWVMAVIDAIRTAWGALSAILASLGAVLGWLKVVRMGGAGLLFAKAVAAGVVALLEVLYQALMNGIGKYVAKVGRRLKGVAAKLAGRGGGRKPRAGGADEPGGRPKADGRHDEPTAGTTPKTPARPRPGSDRPGPTRPSSGRPPAGPGRPGSRRSEPDRPTTPATSRRHPDSTERPRSDRDTPSRPKDEPSNPSRPREQDPAKPRTDGDGSGRPKSPEDGDGSGRPRDHKDGDGRKPKDHKDGDGRRPKDGDEDPRKPKHDRDEDGRRPGDRGRKPRRPGDDGRPGRKPKDRDPERKKEKRDQRKKDEDSKESKEARLRKIVARIRPRIDGMLRRGTGRPILRAALAAMRAWYRLTELSAGENEHFQIQAVLNPTEQVANGLKMDTIELADAVDAMVNHVLRSDHVIAESQRIGIGSPPLGPNGSPTASRTRIVPADVGIAPMLRHTLDNPLPHKGDEILQVEAGDPQYNSRLYLEHSEKGGGGTKLAPEGVDKNFTYAEEAKALLKAEPDGTLMGGRMLESLAGKRDKWQGGQLPNVNTMEQAVFTATLIGLIETGRTPFVMVPNLAAVMASKSGGPHIAELLPELPLSGRAAINNKEDMKEKFGEFSYQVIGGQAAGRQTEWLLAARRMSGLPTYWDDLSSGASVSESVGEGFLNPPKPKGKKHLAPEIHTLMQRFKEVSGHMVQNAYGIGGDKMRAAKPLWEKVAEEIGKDTPLRPPTAASEEVLRRTAVNLKIWADAKGLVYSPKDPKAKGKFLVEIYRELVGIVGMPADSAFESRLERGYNG